MPKQVDHDERRRLIAEAVVTVIGRRGLEHAGLRDVAGAAGVSMGSVQHYFGSKDEMLLFTLGQLSTRPAWPHESSRRGAIRAALQAMLPVDEAGRLAAAAMIAFFSMATATPEYAARLREGTLGLLAVSRARLHDAAAAGELADGIDPDLEGEALFHLGRGLVGPVLVGALTAAEAMAVLDHQLDRIFAPTND